jgi:hypothetical protein
VQRTWSNASALAGHHPCVPAPAVYFTAAPVLTDDVTVPDDGQMTTTRGVDLRVGQSKTIALQLFSDAAKAPWTVTVYDVATVRGTGGAELSFAMDRTTGQNGDVLHVTITRIKPGPRGFSELMIWSSLAGESNFWPVIAGNGGVSAGAVAPPTSSPRTPPHLPTAAPSL